MKLLWRIPEDFPEALIGEYQRETSPDRFDLKEGRRLADNWGVPAFKFDATSESLAAFDCLANNALVPLVSSHMAGIFQSNYGDLVQMIPSQIETQNGSLEGYFLVNVTNLGNCIDMDASEYCCIPETNIPMAFSRLKFLETPDDRAILRDRNYLSFLIVSEEFAKLTEKYGWKGVGLYFAEEIFM